MAQPKEPKVAYIFEDGSNHVSVDMPEHPPRLMTALMWAKPGQIDGYRTKLNKAVEANERGKVTLDSTDKFEEELGLLLDHISQRLQHGLDEAWHSRFGYDAPEIPKTEGKTADEHATARKKAIEKSWALTDLYSQPDEKWARAFAEMFVYMPYGGPARLMLDTSHDEEIYARWPDVYSLVAACQHLSTYAVLTRGFLPSDVGTGLEAGPNGGKAIFGKSLPSSSTERPSWSTASQTEFAKNDLRPGDVLSGDDGADKPNPHDGGKRNLREWGHSATTLRRWPLGAKAEAAPENAGAGHRLQMIDTGVLAGVGDTSTQDYNWLTAVNGFGAAKPGRTGFGRFPEATNLAAAVETTKKALPLGFARLVVVVSGSNEVRYISAMLPMWHGEHRFAFSRYIWSLRDLPVSGLDAYWIIYAPLRNEALVDQIVKEAKGPQRSCQELADAAKTGKGFLRAIASCASINGKPKVVRSVTKGAVGWREVDPNPKKSKDKPPPGAPEEPDPKAPTKLQTTTSVAPTLKLKLDAGPEGRPGGMDFLESRKHLALELLIPVGTKSGDVKGRVAAKNEVPYFKGMTKEPEKKPEDTK